MALVDFSGTVVGWFGLFTLLALSLCPTGNEHEPFILLASQQLAVNLVLTLSF